MESNSKKKLITKATIEKQLKKDTVKTPRSNSGCLITFGGAIIGFCGTILYWMLSTDRAKIGPILCIVGAMLLGCWPIWEAGKYRKRSKSNKALLEINQYRIVKSKCVRVHKEREAEESGPDLLSYTCDLENGEYAVFVEDEITQQDAGDPVEVGTPVYTVYLGEIPRLYYSGKQCELASDLIIEE